MHNLARLRSIICQAAKKGIRIIPIAASDITKDTEYLMRSLALSTNGTYLFLTDHSGIGNPHLEPTTDSYDIWKLNDLIVRIFDQYISAVSCDKYDSYNPEATSDTMNISDEQLFLGDAHSDSSDLHIENNTGKISCSYYPNPTTGLLTIEANGQIEELFLSDVSGKLMQRFRMNGEKRLQVDISPYPIGIYRIMYLENNNPISGMIVLSK